MNIDFEQTYEISCLVIENDQKQNIMNACERVWNEIHRLLLFIIISTIEYHEHEHEPNIYSNGCTILRVNVFCIQHTISDPHHVGEVISPSSSWLGYQHHSNQTWFGYVMCTFVCAPLWDGCASGQVQDLVVGFEQDAAAAAVVMACPAMWYSKMVGFSTHSSSESIKQTTPHHSISSQFSLPLYPPQFIYHLCDIQFL